MAILPTPESSQGILGAIRGSLGLFGDTNKQRGVVDTEENGLPINEYESSLSNEKIIELTRDWKHQYSVYYDPIEKSQVLANNYWVGKHRTSEGQPITTQQYSQQVDNLIFEAIETFLPIATRANPDPLVQADPSPIAQQMAHDIKAALTDWADRIKLRRKLAKGTRSWLLNRIGVFKMSWNPITKTIDLHIVNSKKMLFDKDGFIDEGGHFKGEWLGEKKQHTAEKLVELFPNKSEFIRKKAQNKMGTRLEYIEWWYCGTDVFYTMDMEVLGKFKNPNWNYDGKTTEKDPTTEAEIESEIEGINHLKQPDYPYVFLSVFSTGTQPHDETSLILQNIPIQDRINRRYTQIDDNVKGMNNGMAVSGQAFTEDQASHAASALRRGVAFRVPNPPGGDVRGAVMRIPAPALPRDVFTALEDDRSQVRNIFGTSGSTPEGTEEQKTVRGKIMINQMDASRIGGGITECIEQVADSIYNLAVQFMFVYYDEEHFIATAGLTSGTELVVLKNDRFPLLKTLNITVKEGSLIPKDPLTQRNEAIDLWSASAIDPITFYKRLDFADPIQQAKQLITWQMVQKGALPPQAYIPDFNQQGQAGLPQQGVGGPAVNAPPAQGEQQPPVSESVGQQSSQLIKSLPIR